MINMTKERQLELIREAVELDIIKRGAELTDNERLLTVIETTNRIKEEIEWVKNEPKLYEDCRQVTLKRYEQMLEATYDYGRELWNKTVN